MEKKTVRSKCTKCDATITVSVLPGAASSVATCPQCQAGYEVVVRPCPSCNTTRYIVASPGGRTGDPRCQRCVERAQIADEAHQREQERLAVSAEEQKLNSPPITKEQKAAAGNVLFVAAFLVGLLVFGTLTVVRRMSGKPAVQEARAPDKNLGDTGLLYINADAPSIAVGRTEANLNEILDSLRLSDKEGFTKMALDGKLMLLDTNTPVRVIGRSGFLSQRYRIRILAGDFASEDGWVLQEWVK